MSNWFSYILRFMNISFIMHRFVSVVYGIKLLCSLSLSLFLSHYTKPAIIKRQ